jgi:hypothetical protein
MSKSKDKEWISLLRNIENQVSRLLWNRYLFREFMATIETNSALDTNNPFVVWVWENYLFNAALGVRRLIDRDRRSISLLLLLEDIAKKPEILSRKRYAALFEDSGLSDDTAYINRCFDSLVGEGKDCPDRRDIEHNMQKLLIIAKILIRYVNKMVAHIDKGTIRKLPTINDLDASIDCLADITKKYYAILHAGGVELLPVAQTPWKRIFEIPWISSRGR